MISSKMFQPSELPADMLLKHVQAISAVVNEDARAEDNVVGKKLANELDGIVQDIVAKYSEDSE